MSGDLYGTDLLMTDDGDLQVAPGGDLAAVTDIANLNQAVTNRLLTTPDEYLFGDYGSTLRQYVDSVDPTALTQIPQDVSASLLEDSRVATANVTATQDVGGNTTVQVTYTSAFGDSSSLEVST